MGVRTRLRSFADRHVGPIGLVLIYHRVAELARDPQLLSVSPAKFEAQMRWLRANTHVVSLTDMATMLASKTLDQHSVAVTFDDGYLDNLSQAAPILARTDVPGTVFVSSGYAQTGREYWWDTLERIVLDAPTLPDDLVLTIDAHSFTWSSSGEPTPRTSSDWNVTLPDAGPRERLYRELHAFLRPLAWSVRAEALAELAVACDVDASEPRPSHRPMNPAELSELASAPGMTVGGHTIDHESLSALPPADQERQIVADRVALREMVPGDLELFSYPYGSLDDYTEQTVRIVQAAGYAAACSNHPGVVKPWTDRYRIPRQLVRDWDADEFAVRITSWLEGDR